jgi:hypothetical protein
LWNGVLHLLTDWIGSGEKLGNRKRGRIRLNFDTTGRFGIVGFLLFRSVPFLRRFFSGLAVLDDVAVFGLLLGVSVLDLGVGHPVFGLAVLDGVARLLVLLFVLFLGRRGVCVDDGALDCGGLNQHSLSGVYTMAVIALT